jgi:hypothetical protein
LWRDTSVAEVHNNIIWGNVSGSGIGEDIYIEDDADNDGTSAAVNVFDNVLADLEFQEGDNLSRGRNLDADPLLTASLRLKAGSPCIGKANGSAAHFPGDDFERDRRPEGRGPDIGADEYVAPSETDGGVLEPDSGVGPDDAAAEAGIANPDGGVDSRDGAVGPMDGSAPTDDAAIEECETDAGSGTEGGRPDASPDGGAMVEDLAPTESGCRCRIARPNAFGPRDTTALVLCCVLLLVRAARRRARRSRGRCQRIQVEKNPSGKPPS